MAAFGEGGLLCLHFRKTGRHIATFTLELMCHLFYLKRATVYSGGGELLTSTGDIVERWKEYFEDLMQCSRPGGS